MESKIMKRKFNI